MMSIHHNTERLTIERIVKGVTRRVLNGLGIDVYYQTHDRNILEHVIFPYFVKNQNYQRILFIGCDWYTSGYRHVFANKQYTTLDIDPAKRKYGSPQRHIVDSMVNISRYFPNGKLDLVICNGVFGWGLDDKLELEASFRACYASLRKGGIFVLGWNDLPERTPVPLEELQSLSLFQRYVFPPVGSARFLTDNQRHTYDFYMS